MAVLWDKDLLMWFFLSDREGNFSCTFRAWSKPLGMVWKFKRRQDIHTTVNRKAGNPVPSSGRMKSYWESSANISHVNRSLYIATGCPWEGFCHLPVPERVQLGIKQHWSLSQENGLRSGDVFGGQPWSLQESHRSRGGCSCYCFT